MVAKVKTEVDEALLKEGEAAAFELGLYDMHPEINRLMGRLKFRTSYGQNVLSHSKEVAFLAGIMAREVGLNTQTAVRAAFVHDIGKAIDRDLQVPTSNLVSTFYDNMAKVPLSSMRWPHTIWTSTGRRSKP